MEIELAKSEQKPAVSKQTAFCLAGAVRPAFDPCQRCRSFPTCRSREGYPEDKLTLCPANKIIRANRPCIECEDFEKCKGGENDKSKDLSITLT